MTERPVSEQMRETANSMAFIYGGPDVVQRTLREFANKVAKLEVIEKAMERINYRAKTETGDRHLRDIVIEISDEALKDEK